MSKCYAKVILPQGAPVVLAFFSVGARHYLRHFVRSGELAARYRIEDIKADEMRRFCRLHGDPIHIHDGQVMMMARLLGLVRDEDRVLVETPAEQSVRVEVNERGELVVDPKTAAPYGFRRSGLPYKTSPAARAAARRQRERRKEGK